MVEISRFPAYLSPLSISLKILLPNFFLVYTHTDGKKSHSARTHELHPFASPTMIQIDVPVAKRHKGVET
jgi:hypothetical protein